MIIQRGNQKVFSNQELQDMINDYGSNSAKIDSHSDDNISVGGSGMNIGDNVDTYGGKPKILKDSSKYVKKQRNTNKSLQPNTHQN